MTPAVTPPAPASTDAAYLVLAAWHCEACDVQGRSPADVAPTCWNCGGPVVVTARPVLRLDES